MSLWAIGTVLASGDLVTPDMCKIFEPYSWEWYLWACWLSMGYMRLLPILMAGVLAFGAAAVVRKVRIAL